MKPRVKKPNGKPMHIRVREAAVDGNARFSFFCEHGRLPRIDEDVSMFIEPPFTTGEYYIDEITGNMVVWVDGKWEEVLKNLQATEENDHFNVDDSDLNMLLNLAGDMLTGQGNMDTALMFSHYLEKVEERLKKNG